MERNMSIGFYARGTVGKIEDMVEKARNIAEQSGFGIGVGEEGMRIRLCPMGDLDITWCEEEGHWGRWIVESDCQTSQAGAGFHKAALELVESLGLQNFTVDDETDYYSHRDFEKMRKEHFYHWLQQLLRICRNIFTEGGNDQICLCWDMDLYHPEKVESTVAAPLGRYTVESMEKIVAEEGVEALAKRFFLWENEERDALFYRNRALYHLWIRCYFAPSSRSSEDRDVNGAILDDLEKAYAMEPGIPIPHEAYREVCRRHHRTPVIPGTVEELSFEFPVGYRKKRIVEGIGSLRLTLPGKYLYEWEEDGEGGGVNLWSDDSKDSPVWRVSSFQRRSGKAEFTEHLNGLRDLEEHEISNGRIRFGWRPCREDGDSYYIVECEVITGPSLYVITIAYRNPEEKEEVVELLLQLSAVETKTSDQ